MDKKQYIEAGRIVNTHGVRGELKIEVWLDSAEFLRSFKRVFIGERVDVLERPASNIYVVKGETEHLIPAVPEFVMSTDAENGLITVRLIEGM